MNPFLERAIRYGAFPAIFGGGMALGVHGLAEGWSPTILVGAIVFACGAALILLERLLPYERAWSESKGDLPTDALHTAVSMVLVPQAWTAFGLAALVAAGGALSARGLGLWPADWPLLAQGALAVFVGDFFYYWLHRWMHESDWGWRLHAPHHSAPRLYWLNAGRFHPIDTLLGVVVQTGSVALLGAPAEAIAVISLFTGMHGMFQHCNVDVRLGPLNWVFSAAELHRWHHAPDAATANHNYASKLALWDIVFGTRLWAPDRRPPVATGIETLPNFPGDYLGQLAAPFRWERVAAEAVAAREA